MDKPRLFFPAPLQEDFESGRCGQMQPEKEAEITFELAPEVSQSNKSSSLNRGHQNMRNVAKKVDCWLPQEKIDMSKKLLRHQKDHFTKSTLMHAEFCL